MISKCLVAIGALRIIHTCEFQRAPPIPEYSSPEKGIMDLKLPDKYRVALWVYLVVDAALILVAFILGFISMMASRTEPAQFGFFCDDESIRYPVKDDTFTDDLVSALSFTVPLLLVSRLGQARASPGRPETECIIIQRVPRVGWCIDKYTCKDKISTITVKRTNKHKLNYIGCTGGAYTPCLSNANRQLVHRHGWCVNGYAVT